MFFPGDTAVMTDCWLCPVPIAALIVRVCAFTFRAAAAAFVTGTGRVVRVASHTTFAEVCSNRTGARVITGEPVRTFSVLDCHRVAGYSGRVPLQGSSAGCCRRALLVSDDRRHRRAVRCGCVGSGRSCRHTNDSASRRVRGRQPASRATLCCCIPYAPQHTVTCSKSCSPSHSV